MIATYAPMFLMIAVASLLAGAFFTGATYLGGKVNKTEEKMKPFECGSESSGGNHIIRRESMAPPSAVAGDVLIASLEPGVQAV